MPDQTANFWTHLAGNEAALRLAVFFGVLAVMAAWETASPARPPHKRLLRTFNNLAIAGLNNLLVRLAAPLGLVGIALWAQTQGLGAIARLHLPFGIAVAGCVVALDLAVYAQHRLFHAVPLLWRVHRMHHADLEFDVTTGVRFHPVEIALSFAIKAAAIVMLGAPALAVALFEILLNASSMFSHGNVHIPNPLERLVRWGIVTPDMHRVHHSTVLEETNSNFGFNLSCWDRLFATYRVAPAAGHTRMNIGLDDFHDESELELPSMLTMPLRSPSRQFAPMKKDGRISIIVPVLNEAATIEHLLSGLAAARKHGAEILVVDGGSTDNTVALATKLADKVIEAPRGRASQMNEGASRAHGSILWFVHADTAPPTNGCTAILNALADGKRVWGRFDVRIAPASATLRAVAALMNWRSRLTGIATGDQAIFVRRTAFEGIGGFPPIALMEDIALSHALKRLSRPACLRDRVTTSARRWRANGTVRTILLMWRLRLAFFFGADPARLAAIYGYEPNSK